MPNAGLRSCLIPLSSARPSPLGSNYHFEPISFDVKNISIARHSGIHAGMTGIRAKLRIAGHEP